MRWSGDKGKMTVLGGFGGWELVMVVVVVAVVVVPEVVVMTPVDVMVVVVVVVVMSGVLVGAGGERLGSKGARGLYTRERREAGRREMVSWAPCQDATETSGSELSAEEVVVVGGGGSVEVPDGSSADFLASWALRLPAAG